MGVEHALGRQEVLKGRGVVEITEPDGEDEGEKDRQRDPDVHGAVGEKPEHEAAFRRHHVRVLFRLLGLAFMLAQRGPGVLSRSCSTRRMRWRVEAFRLL